MSMHMNSICRGTTRLLRRKRWRVFQYSFSIPKAHTCEESTVIQLQKRLLSQGTGGQLPIEPGRGASGLGAINTHGNNWKLNALLSPTVMIPAGFAQKIALPFHLSYLLIFLKSVSASSFLGCSHKRAFCCWSGVRGLVGIPGTLYKSPQEQVEAGKSHSTIEGWLPLRACRATNMFWMVFQLLYLWIFSSPP